MHSIREKGRASSSQEVLPYIPSLTCPVCGNREFAFQDVLWQELIDRWELLPAETAAINRQQGLHCLHCHANLRSMTLAAAVCEYFSWPQSLTALLQTDRPQPVRLLEINEAGTLHPLLARFPNGDFISYPQADMQKLELPAGHYDLVIHSDTLEHIPDPIAGLRECRRILKPGGFLMLTIPIVPGRLTRRRDHLPPSFHGSSGQKDDDQIVHSEYGADFFLDFIQAGFFKTTLFTLGSPDSFAVIGAK